jgi:hypothetical protein
MVAVTVYPPAKGLLGAKQRRRNVPAVIGSFHTNFLPRQLKRQKKSVFVRRFLSF